MSCLKQCSCGTGMQLGNFDWCWNLLARLVLHLLSMVGQ